jgi:hypothetical protein
MCTPKLRAQNGAVGAPIGAQDINQSSDDWRPGYQESGNELSIYIAHELSIYRTFQFGIRRGASSTKMKTGFVNQNINFKKL